MTITRSQNPMTADPGARIGVLAAPAELDLITADGLDEQGRDAIGRHARLLLLDLTGLSFCDARRLGALVRIANNADVARCRYALIAPQSAVVKTLRITGLSRRLPTFASIRDALAHLTP